MEDWNNGRMKPALARMFHTPDESTTARRVRARGLQSQTNPLRLVAADGWRGALRRARSGPGGGRETQHPRPLNRRADPFEPVYDGTLGGIRFMADRFFLMVPAQAYVGQFLAPFKAFPPSQKVGSFSLDQVLEMRTKGAGDK